MTKQQFIETLEIELKRRNISEISDIIEEYEQHFAFKLADGYAEEEIAAKLGDPKGIAAQYDASPAEGKGGKKVITRMGLGVADFFFGIFYILMFAWEIVMAALAAAFGAVSIGLFTNMRISVFALLPAMPYHCAFLFGVAFAALTILSVVGSIYFFGFIRQLMRSFCRFHRNTLASVSGGAALPSVAPYPQFSAKMKRNLKKISLLAVAVFAVCFIAGFIICGISAGSVQFWHTWRWFGYVG